MLDAEDVNLNACLFSKFSFLHNSVWVRLTVICHPGVRKLNNKKKKIYLLLFNSSMLILILTLLNHQTICLLVQIYPELEFRETELRKANFCQS